MLFSLTFFILVFSFFSYLFCSLSPVLFNHNKKRRRKIKRESRGECAECAEAWLKLGQTAYRKNG